MPVTLIRRTAVLLGALALLVTMAACGSAAGPAGGAPSADAGFPRTLTTPKGPVTIPAKPRRVVVLDTAELDSVTLLGITPVGAIPPHLSDDTAFPAYLADKLAGTVEVGTSADPNLEQIASLGSSPARSACTTTGRSSGRSSPTRGWRGRRRRTRTTSSPGSRRS